MKRWPVEVTVEGLNLERCIRRCAERGILLTGLQRTDRTMHALLPEARLDEFCQLVTDGGWQLTIGRRHGMGRVLEGINRRWLLMVGCLLAVAMLLSSTAVMWRVEIRDAGVYLGDIRSTLLAMDIMAPKWKREIDPNAVRDALEYRYPRIAWIECGWRGSTLLISIHEGVQEGETLDVNGCCDVVAARDGVVDTIITVAGTPQVRAGQTVRKGDVLIRGEERGADETVHPVAARGSVLARVWDAATVQISAMEQVTTYTGRTFCRDVLRLPWFTLSRPEPSPFAQQDLSIRIQPIGGLFLPLTVEHQLLMEATMEVRQRDEDQLHSEAAVLALRKLREKIGTDDKLIDKWVEYSTIEDGIMQAVAYCERLLNIAVRSDSFQP